MEDKAQSERAQRFRALHAGGTFVIANCWDGGSARILAALGFPALATSSGASAGTLGRLDGNVSLDEALAQARTICGATSLPVSADLEKGFGDAPAATAKAIALAARVPAWSAAPSKMPRAARTTPIFDLGFGHRTRRGRGRSRAQTALPFHADRARRELSARPPDLDDTIRRLQAFERAGADVLFAPGLPDLAAVRTVCASLTKPVNFMVGIRGKSFSVAELAQAGVRRISLADLAVSRRHDGLADAAREIRECGHLRLSRQQHVRAANSRSTSRAERVKLVDCEPRRHSAPILAIFNEAIANSTALYDYKPRASPNRWWAGSRPKPEAAIRSSASKMTPATLVGFAQLWPVSRLARLQIHRRALHIYR